MSHPFVVISETNEKDNEASIVSKVWNFVYPSAPGGIDSSMINPLANDVPVYLELFVWVAGKDELRIMLGLLRKVAGKVNWSSWTLKERIIAFTS